jgi:hypothetical protein
MWGARRLQVGVTRPRSQWSGTSKPEAGAIVGNEPEGLQEFLRRTLSAKAPDHQ